MNCVSVSFGEGKYGISGTAVLCGEDASLSFTGGTRPHIGAVSLAVYEPVRDSATVSTIAVYTHRDNELAEKCAKTVAAALKCTVTVSVGIHIDDAGPSELEILIKNFHQCCQRMIEEIRQAKDG